MSPQKSRGATPPRRYDKVQSLAAQFVKATARFEMVNANAVVRRRENPTPQSSALLGSGQTQGRTTGNQVV